MANDRFDAILANEIRLNELSNTPTMSNAEARAAAAYERQQKILADATKFSRSDNPLLAALQVVFQDIAAPFAGSAVRGAGTAQAGVSEFLNLYKEDEIAKLPVKLQEEILNARRTLESRGAAPEESANLLTRVGEAIKEIRTFEGKQESEGSRPTGNMDDPSTWSLGTNPSLLGYVMNTADTIGEMAPMLLAGKALGPTGNFLVGGAQAAAGATQDIRDTLASKSDQELLAESPRMQELTEELGSATLAREALIKEMGLASATGHAIMGGVGDALLGKVLGGTGTKLTDKLLSSVAEGSGIAAKTAGVLSRSRVGNAAVVGAGTMAQEGISETAETVVANMAANATAQGKLLDPYEGTFGDFVGGALAGGALGAKSSWKHGKEVVDRNKRVKEAKDIVNAALASGNTSKVNKLVSLGEDSKGLERATHVAEQNIATPKGRKLAVATSNALDSAIALVETELSKSGVSAAREAQLAQDKEKVAELRRQKKAGATTGDVLGKTVAIDTAIDLYSKRAQSHEDFIANSGTRTKELEGRLATLQARRARLGAVLSRTTANTAAPAAATASTPAASTPAPVEVDSPIPGVANVSHALRTGGNVGAAIDDALTTHKDSLTPEHTKVLESLRTLVNSMNNGTAWTAAMEAASQDKAKGTRSANKPSAQQYVQSIANALEANDGAALAVITSRLSTFSQQQQTRAAKLSEMLSKRKQGDTRAMLSRFNYKKGAFEPAREKKVNELGQYGDIWVDAGDAGTQTAERMLATLNQEANSITSIAEAAAQLREAMGEITPEKVAERKRQAIRKSMGLSTPEKGNAAAPVVETRESEEAPNTESKTTKEPKYVVTNVIRDNKLDLANPNSWDAGVFSEMFPNDAEAAAAMAAWAADTEINLEEATNLYQDILKEMGAKVLPAYARTFIEGVKIFQHQRTQDAEAKKNKKKSKSSREKSGNPDVVEAVTQPEQNAQAEETAPKTEKADNFTLDSLPKQKNAPKLRGKTANTPKDQAKANVATKFIGEGVVGSSTALYAGDFGDRANNLDYTSDDVVFISANGVRKNRVAPLAEESTTRNAIDAAIQAGATFVLDTLAYRTSNKFVLGDREVADYLLRNGYVELNGSGVFQPADSTSQSVPTAESIQTDTATENTVEEDLDTVAEEEVSEEMPVETLDTAPVVAVPVDSTKNQETSDKETGVQVQGISFVYDGTEDSTAYPDNYALPTENNALRAVDEDGKPVIHLLKAFFKRKKADNILNSSKSLMNPAFLAKYPNIVNAVETITTIISKKNLLADLVRDNLNAYSYKTPIGFLTDGKVLNDKAQAAVLYAVYSELSRYVEQKVSTAERIRSMLGLKNNDGQIRGTDAKYLEQMISNRNELIGRMGAAAYAALGITTRNNPNIPEDLKNTLVAQLGITAYEYAVGMDLIQAGDQIFIHEGKIITFEQSLNIYSGVTTTYVVSRGSKLASSTLAKEFALAEDDLTRAFEGEDSERVIRTRNDIEADTPVYKQKHNRRGAPISEEQRKAEGIKSEANWVVNTEVAKVWNAIPDTGDKVKIFTDSSLDNAVSPLSLSSIAAAISGAIEHIHKAQKMADTYTDTGSPLIIPSEVKSTLRSGYRAFTDPQANKVARALLTQDNWGMELDLNKEQPSDVFWLALAQGFGINIDNESDAIALAKEKLTTQEFKDAAVVVTEALKGTALTPEKSGVLASYVQSLGEKMHSFSAVVAATQYINAVNSSNAADKKITVNFGMETDGKANGASITAVMYGLVGKGFNFFNAAGLFTTAGMTEFAQYIAAGGKDIYQYLGAASVRYLNDIFSSKDSLQNVIGSDTLGRLGGLEAVKELQAYLLGGTVQNGIIHLDNKKTRTLAKGILTPVNFGSSVYNAILSSSSLLWDTVDARFADVLNKDETLGKIVAAAQRMHAYSFDSSSAEYIAAKEVYSENIQYLNTAEGKAALMAATEGFNSIIGNLNKYVQIGLAKRESKGNPTIPTIKGPGQFLEAVTNFSLSEDTYDVINTAYDALMGKAIRSSFDNELVDQMDQRQTYLNPITHSYTTTKVLYESLWKAYLDNLIDTGKIPHTETKTGIKTAIVSEKVRQNFNKMFQEVLPQIQTAFAGDEKAILVEPMQVDKDADSTGIKVKDGALKNRTATAKLGKFALPRLGTAPLPTSAHNLDSAVMERALTRLFEKTGVRILNLHDAGMTSLRVQGLLAELLNEEFFKAVTDYHAPDALTDTAISSLEKSLYAAREASKNLGVPFEDSIRTVINAFISSVDLRDTEAAKSAAFDAGDTKTGYSLNNKIKNWDHALKAIENVPPLKGLDRVNTLLAILLDSAQSAYDSKRNKLTQLLEVHTVAQYPMPGHNWTVTQEAKREVEKKLAEAEPEHLETKERIYKLVGRLISAARFESAAGKGNQLKAKEVAQAFGVPEKEAEIAKLIAQDTPLEDIYLTVATPAAVAPELTKQAAIYNAVLNSINAPASAKTPQTRAIVPNTPTRVGKQPAVAAKSAEQPAPTSVADNMQAKVKGLKDWVNSFKDSENISKLDSHILNMLVQGIANTAKMFSIPFGSHQSITVGDTDITVRYDDTLEGKVYPATSKNPVYAFFFPSADGRIPRTTRIHEVTHAATQASINLAALHAYLKSQGVNPGFVLPQGVEQAYETTESIRKALIEHFKAIPVDAEGIPEELRNEAFRNHMLKDSHELISTILSTESIRNYFGKLKLADIGLPARKKETSVLSAVVDSLIKLLNINTATVPRTAIYNSITANILASTEVYASKNLEATKRMLKEEKRKSAPGKVDTEQGELFSVADITPISELPADNIFEEKPVQKTSNRLNKKSLKSLFLKSPLSDAISQLIDSGRIVLHDRAPANARKKAVEGWMDKKGRVHLVASNLTSITAIPTLFHEFFHNAASRFKNNPKTISLMSHLEDIYNTYKTSPEGSYQNKYWKAALARVDNAKTSESLRVEEFGAYAVTEFEKAPPSLRKWVQTFVGHVQAQVLSYFGKQLGALSPAQLRAMSIMAIRSEAAAYTKTSKLTQNPEVQEALTNLFSHGDIAKLKSSRGTSLQMFASAFVNRIAPTDRKLEDAESLAKKILSDIKNRPEQLFPSPTAESLKATRDRMLRMSDGQMYDPENPAHIRATGETMFAHDARVSGREESQLWESASLITERRTDSLRGLIAYLENSEKYDDTEIVTMAVIASKYAMHTSAGNVKVTEIKDDNLHLPAVTSLETADLVIQNLRKGMSAKKALVDALEQGIEKAKERNLAVGREGLVKFPQSDKYEDAVELNEACAGTPWCTGSDVATAKTHRSGGDFYVYFEDGKPRVAFRMQANGVNLAESPRGTVADQSLTESEERAATSLLEAGKVPGGIDYLKDREILAAFEAGNLATLPMSDLVIARSGRRSPLGYSKNGNTFPNPVQREIMALTRHASRSVAELQTLTDAELAEVYIVTGSPSTGPLDGTLLAKMPNLTVLKNVKITGTVDKVASKSIRSNQLHFIDAHIHSNELFEVVDNSGSVDIVKSSVYVLINITGVIYIEDSVISHPFLGEVLPEFVYVSSSNVPKEAFKNVPYLPRLMLWGNISGIDIPETLQIDEVEVVNSTSWPSDTLIQAAKKKLTLDRIDIPSPVEMSLDVEQLKISEIAGSPLTISGRFSTAYIRDAEAPVSLKNVQGGNAFFRYAAESITIQGSDLGYVDILSATGSVSTDSSSDIETLNIRDSDILGDVSLLHRGGQVNTRNTTVSALDINPALKVVGELRIVSDTLEDTGVSYIEDSEDVYELDEDENFDDIPFSIAAEPIEANTAVETYPLSEAITSAIDSDTKITPEHAKELRNILRTLLEPLVAQLGIDPIVTTMEVNGISVEDIAYGIAPLTKEAVTAGLSLGKSEMLVIEQLHQALTYLAANEQLYAKNIAKTLKDAAEGLTYEDFLPVRNNPSAADIEQAKQLYDMAIAGIGKTATERQMAAVALILGSQTIRSVMSKHAKAKAPKQKPFNLDTFLRKTLEKVSDLIQDRITHANRTGKYSERINALTLGLVKTRKGLYTRIAQIPDMADSGMAKLDAKVNSLSRAIAESVRDKMLSVHAKLRPSSSAASMQKLITTALDKDVESVFGEIQGMVTRTEKLNNDFILGLIQELRGEDENTAAFYETARAVQAMQRERELRGRAVRSVISKAFGSLWDTLTSDEKGSLTRGVLRTNMQAIYRDSDTAEVRKLITNEGYRKFVRGQLLQSLDEITKDLGAAEVATLKWQIESLGIYQATGIATSPLLALNADTVLISSIGNSLEGTPSHERLVKLTTKLASLYALDNLEYPIKKALTAVVEKDADTNKGDGLEAVLQAAKLNVDNSADLFKGDAKLLRQDGYVPDLLDGNITQIVVSEEAADRYEKLGYTRQGVVSKDALDANSEHKVILTINDGGLAARVEGGFMLAGNHVKGTEVEIKSVSDIRKRSEVLSTLATSGVSPKATIASGERFAVPIYNEQGQISGLRYVMSDAFKDSVLNRNSDIDEVLARNVERTFNKLQSTEHNLQLVDHILEYRRVNADNPNIRWVTLSDDSENGYDREDWKLLPEATKYYVEQLTGKRELVIPANMHSVLFGMRKRTFGDFVARAAGFFNGEPMTDKDLDAVGSYFSRNPDTGDKLTIKELTWGHFKEATGNLIGVGLLAALGNDALLKAKRADGVYRGIISTWKNINVVRNIKKVASDFISNLSILFVNGASPLKVLPKLRENFELVLEYQKLKAEVGEMRLLRDMESPKFNSNAASKLKMMQDRLANHKVRRLDEAGLIQSIVTDTTNNTENNQDLARLYDRFDKMRFVPNGVKDALRELAITPSSATYQAMHTLASSADIVCRMSMVDHLLSTGMGEERAIAVARDSFVDYSIPTTPTIQALDDYGIFPFSKYYLRMTKVYLKLWGQSPTRMLATDMAQSFGFISDSIGNAQIMHKLLANNVVGPFDVFDGVGNIGTFQAFDWMFGD